MLNAVPERHLGEDGELDIVMSTAEYAKMQSAVRSLLLDYYYTENTRHALDGDGVVTLTILKSYDVVDLIMAGFDVIGMTAFYKDAATNYNKEFAEHVQLRECNLARAQLASIVYDPELTKVITNTNEARITLYSDERVQEVMELYKLAGGNIKDIKVDEFDKATVLTIRSFSDFDQLLEKDACVRKKSWVERVSYTPGEVEIDYYNGLISSMSDLKFIKALEPDCIIAEVEGSFDFNRLYFAISNLKLNGRVEMIDGVTYISFRDEVTLTTLKALGLDFEGSKAYQDFGPTTIDVEDFYKGGINDRETPKNYYGDRGNGGRQ